VSQPPYPAPFDAVAHDYDASFTDTEVGRLHRASVWRHLETVLEPSSRILELGCGTGEDALWLARGGHRVLATDASTAMLDLARRKIGDAGLADRVRFATLDLGAIDGEPEPGDAPFDAVFSNFGALNCIAGCRELGRVLHRWVRPGGRAVFVVMGPFCLWETVWYTLRLRPRTATRRWRDGREATVGGGPAVRVWYPTAAGLGRQLSPWFRLREKRAVGALVPPADAAGPVHRRPELLRRLEALDRRWGHRLSAIADHTLLSLERVDDAG
jgi:SAM-dependent methyltransferase